MSIAVHGVLIVLLFAIRFSSAPIFQAAHDRVTLIAPVSEMPSPRAIVPMPRLREVVRREFQPVPIPRVKVPDVVVMAAPVLEAPKPILPKLPPAPTIAAVKESVFSEVKPATQAPRPAIKVSGFQSTETLAAAPGRGALPTTGGFDAASTESAPARRSVVTRSGFSDAAGPVATDARRGSISSGAFGDTTVDKGAAVAKQTKAPAAMTPVEILSKPKPAYTKEARAKGIEGEVLLEVQFGASGEARVLRMMRGLGYGLDESAMAAARGIRFRPAMREGATVDFAAIVHITFQLAN